MRNGIAVLGLVVGLAVAGLAGCGEAPAEQPPKGVVVATIGERQITLDELDAKAQAANMKPYQDLYNARRSVLDRMIETQLISDEAAARGISEEELFQTEVTSNLTPATPQEIEAFFNENQQQMGGQTLEAMSPRIGQFLNNQRAVEARGEFLKQLRSKSKFAINLEPPRVDVQLAANDPAMGPQDAPVTIVEFSDFQCPYCNRVGPTMHQLKEEYGDKLRIVFRDYPLNFHKEAQGAAEAAQCAHEQGKFWEYHDVLFANQRALQVTDLKKYAVDLGLDPDQFNACVDENRYRDDVLQDAAYGNTVGVTGTPAFFINGRFISGAQPLEAFRQIIDQELGDG